MMEEIYNNEPKTKNGFKRKKKILINILLFIITFQIPLAILSIFIILVYPTKYELSNLENYVAIVITLFNLLILAPIIWADVLVANYRKGIKIDYNKNIIFPGFWGIGKGEIYPFDAFKDIIFSNRYVFFIYSKNFKKPWYSLVNKTSYALDYIYELDDFKKVIEKNKDKLSSE